METTDLGQRQELMRAAFAARAELIDGAHETALRLFNGFYEGWPQLVVDLYAHTLVLYGYAEDFAENQALLNEAQGLCLELLPWVRCVVQKNRSASDSDWRSGQITYGGPADDWVREHGVLYAVNLRLNQDASFYLDMRQLRGWLLQHSAGWSVANFFAYTGSLGIAALAGGAAQVIQVDRNRKFLNLAASSLSLNGLDATKMELQAADFFKRVAFYKRQPRLFDCVILDPPFFSSTSQGTVNLVGESVRLINKVRPLVADGGWLVAVNNALFLSGKAYLQALQDLCSDGYLAIEELIPVPADMAGYPHTIASPPPSDPEPFNHPTKIALLRVRRKQDL
jgi:23S rRNA (cytosine1962-C5)-methyltransferase